MGPINLKLLSGDRTSIEYDSTLTSLSSLLQLAINHSAAAAAAAVVSFFLTPRFPVPDDGNEKVKKEVRL